MISVEDYQVVRAALVKIIGTDNVDDLNSIRAAVHSHDGLDPETKAGTLAGVDALLKTNPNKKSCLN